MMCVIYKYKVCDPFVICVIQKYKLSDLQPQNVSHSTATSIIKSVIHNYKACDSQGEGSRMMKCVIHNYNVS